MTLTPLQLRVLKAQLAYRTHPPSVARYIRASGLIYLGLALISGFGAVFFASAGWPMVGGFFAGAVFWVFLRDLRYFRQFVRGWPLSNELTRWDRVDEILRENPGDATR